jgi:hypothetical protein
MSEMEPQIAFNWIVGVAGTLGGWTLKVIWDSIQSLRSDDFKEAVTDLRSDMKEGFKETKDMIGLLFKKIEGKADK